VAKTTDICIKFPLDVAFQKLLKSENVSRSYLKNKSSWHLFMDHSVWSLTPDFFKTLHDKNY